MAKAEHAIFVKKQEAIDGARKVRQLDVEIKELEEKHGIDKKRAARDQVKQLLKGFMRRKEIKRLDDSDETYVALVTPTRKTWVLTKKDMPDPKPKGAKPLKVILTKEQFKKVTKRVLDEEALAEAVEDGLIDEDDIAPAFVEIDLEPYIRLY